MAKLLFSLRGVPDDEAEEVRELLDNNNISYYETPAGKWGISSPGLWLKDESAYEHARHLLDQYQQQRYTRQREEYNRQKREGKHHTLVDSFRGDPFKFILYIVIIGVVLYFSIKPFLMLG